MDLCFVVVVVGVFLLDFAAELCRQSVIVYFQKYGYSYEVLQVLHSYYITVVNLLLWHLHQARLCFGSAHQAPKLFIDQQPVTVSTRTHRGGINGP